MARISIGRKSGLAQTGPGVIAGIDKEAAVTQIRKMRACIALRQKNSGPTNCKIVLLKLDNNCDYVRSEYIRTYFSDLS